MTDTEGTEARRSDGEETQFIQPIRDYGRAETKPLDLPRATIGGYRADAVERRVAELERRRTLDQAEIIRLKRENHARQTENGELNQRLTMLREQNKKLEYQASNPYEHIGVDMQNMVNGAKAERKAILDKAETEARTILGKARAKAETLTAEAKKKADEQIEQATRRKQGIDCLCSISCCGFSHDDFSGLGRACRPRNGLNWMVLVSPPERTGKDYDQHAPSTVYPSFAAERGIRRVDRAENTCQRADGA